jgi:PAS domain S-box-containing protein
MSTVNMSTVQSIRVLLIEDEAGDAYLVKSALKQTIKVSFDVTWVESIALATQALAESSFDVLLLDLSLPDSEGLETVAIAKQIMGDIPIIVLTGREDVDFALTVLEAGAADYAAKDIVKNSSDGLARMIRYALSRTELEASNKLLAAANLDLDLLHTLDGATIISETDLNGTIGFVNEQFCKISGYSKSELLGETHKMIQSGVHSKEFYLNMWSLIKSGQIWSGEICNRKKSGEEYWLQAIILPVYHRNDYAAHYRYALVGLDITEKKKREQAMQNRAALYEAAIETTDGFCRISGSGQFLEVSDGYCHLSGYSREELLTMNILKMTGDFVISLQQFSVIVQGNGKTFEIEQRRKDGSIWMAELTASYTKLNDGGSSLFIFLHDVTERVEMQKRDKILRDQIAHMQKVDSIGRLTAGIGHDFNNMLNGILGYADLSREIINEDMADSDLKTDLEHNLSRVMESGNRAKELIAKMMNYCRQNNENAEIEQTVITKSTSQIIKEAVEMVQAGLTAKFQIELELNDTPHIYIAAIDLHQIMTNLLVNARDAMKSKGGGVIKVKLTTINILTYQCAACLQPVEGDFIELSVTDSGSGIDKKVMDEMFDPFFTTKAIGEGTGLGLSTVSGIVHHEGGHILIDSTLGVGTTFKLLFEIK